MEHEAAPVPPAGPAGATTAPDDDVRELAPAGTASPSDALTRALLASVFVIAACGLVYELIAAATSTYLLGDSVTQFSVVIGVYPMRPVPRG